MHSTRRCGVGLDKALRYFRKSAFNPDKDELEMNECHAAALSKLIVDHIRLARSRYETLGWLIPSIQRWLASSRQRFGSAKWILCRLGSFCSIAGSSRREGFSPTGVRAPQWRRKFMLPQSAADGQSKNTA